ncbi:metallophosphoesterase family protein [Bacteroidota bacterium]
MNKISLVAGMKRIGLLSDTHGLIPKALENFFSECDEIWHAGDWGSLELVEALEKFKPLRAVFGNIDGQEFRIRMPEVLEFEVEGLRVCMLHIGGYPGKYSPLFKKVVRNKQFDLMISGHSHILKVMRDPLLGMMHMNPGAAGKHGFHKVCTALRFEIDAGQLKNLEVWEQKPELVQPGFKIG